MTLPLPEAAPRRLAVLDGVRGLAIILVVFSHGWTIWPTDSIKGKAVIAPLFHGGDVAVTVFFVIGAFFATSAMLRAAESPLGLRPGILTLRRFLRLAGQMWFLLLVVLLVTALDTTDTYPQTATRESVLRAATFTWNWYVHDNAFVARPDIGHLWYLAVDLQMFLVILATVWLLRRHRVWLVVALATMLLVLIVWRADIYSYDPFGALVRTWARGDAAVAGALAAAAIGFLRPLERHAPLIAGVSAACLVPLLYVSVDLGRYMSWGGAALDVVLAAFVVACMLRPAPPGLAMIFGRRPLTFLGRHSLSLYLWHYPVFWFVARHTTEWRWEPKLLLALAITGLGAYVSERVVESRVERALAADWWNRTDGGLSAYVWRRARKATTARWGALRGRPEAEASSLRGGGGA
jgi:peptidoglycan/LPS O-acetylase OafA/YrhL